MPEFPAQPEPFARHVAEVLQRLRPGYDIELVGHRELLVNGRRLDLDNLLRMVRHDPRRGDEIVEQFLVQLFDGEGLELADMPFDLARPRIMPRIQPVEIFDHLSRELVAHVPFVNDTVIVFVIDLPQMTVSITTEQLLRWGVDEDDLDLLARENLEDASPPIDVTPVESREGGRAVVLAEQDGYDAARILLPGFHRALASSLGGDFLVALPSRDMVVAMSTGPIPFVERLRRRVDEDFRRMPYPITPELFYVTRDGVAGTIDRETYGLAA